ncbi:hypothetical protein [Formosa sp. A9]|uniref:hypothetical protein n=1 Tax=Formosa sp. A9 TaxID=3442641 RepID=UPI003EC01664
MFKPHYVVFSCLLFVILYFATSSCTIDKTDYEDELTTEIPEYIDYEEAVKLSIGNYNISIQALNGTLYTGYNDIRLTVTNSSTNQEVSDVDVTLLPIKTNAINETSSGPHQYHLNYNNENGYYSGYVVFPNKSDVANHWQFYIGITDVYETLTASQDINVAEQSNKNLNMTTFLGHDNDMYYIALVAPQSPKIAENKLVAGIYKYNPPANTSTTFPDPEQFSYSEVENYTLKLDPRMPEPSMGNHSSPNNKDLIQEEDKLYHGVVNYTMTGNWTLNFILINQNGKIVKGTEVPTDFTPGIEGAKSELFIDILF